MAEGTEGTQEATPEAPVFTGSPLIDEPAIEATPETQGDGELDTKPAAEPEAAPEKETTKEGPGKDREGWIPRERFDEVNAKVKDLMGKVEAMSKAPKAEPAEPAEPGFLEEFSAMDPDEQVDLWEENPAEVLGKIVAAVTEKVSGDLATQTEAKSYESKVNESLESFAKENPDFDGLWDSGKIQKLMDENPLHSPISAYNALTKDAREAAAAEKIEKARKDERAKVLKEIRTGKENSSLPAGRSAAPLVSNDFAPELKNPADHGMTTTQALAADLKAFRAGKKGG